MGELSKNAFIALGAILSIVAIIFILAAVAEMIPGSDASAPPPKARLRSLAKGQMLDVRGQAALVHHHMDYVNDVDEGLNDALRRIRVKEDQWNSVPIPPHHFDHNPTPSHNLDRLPLPPDHSQEVDDNDSDNADDSAIPIPPLDAVDQSATTTASAQTASEQTRAIARRISSPAATGTDESEESNEGPQVIADAKTLNDYSHRFAKKHKIMKAIHVAEREVHDRLRAVHSKELDVAKRQSIVNRKQQAIRKHQEQVAQQQADVLDREIKLMESLKKKAAVGKYLDNLQKKLDLERKKIQKDTRKQFAQIIAVEQDILSRLQKQAARRAIPPPPSEPSHKVLVNVNREGAVHVRVRAKKLGHDGLVEINVNEGKLDKDEDDNTDTNAQEKIKQKRSKFVNGFATKSAAESAAKTLSTAAALEQMQRLIDRSRKALALSSARVVKQKEK